MTVGSAVALDGFKIQGTHSFFPTGDLLESSAEYIIPVGLIAWQKVYVPFKFVPTGDLLESIVAYKIAVGLIAWQKVYIPIVDVILRDVRVNGRTDTKGLEFRINLKKNGNHGGGQKTDLVVGQLTAS